MYVSKYGPQEIWHNKGLCFVNARDFEQAVDCLRKANSIQQHDITFIQLGKIYTLQERYDEAIDIYLEALEYSPQNPELLTTVGLLYLRIHENHRAFDYLGNALTYDAKNPKVRT